MTPTKRFILCALVGSLSSGLGFAQTHTGLLEKGIFLEETAGDLDGAVRVYRQILAAHEVARDVGSQAERRLAEILQRKGGAPQVAAAPTQQPDPNACCGMFSSNYDVNRPVTVMGKVIQVQWINPQSVVVVDGTDGNLWGLTIAAPNAMIRGGLNKTTFKPGEEVIVEGYLAKGTGESCPTALPNACETLALPAPSTAAQQGARGAQHASAKSITTIDGRNLFDRQAMEKAAAAAGQQ